jgi:hypothetical protein
MRLSAQLIVLTTWCTLLLAASPTFRGLSPADLSRGVWPLSFEPLIQEQYPGTAGQLRFARGTYIIITPDVLEPYLDPLVVFKRSQGFDVAVWRLSEIGDSAAEIKAAIQAELAANPLLEYVLLIGDVDGVGTMPSFYYGPSNDVSDQQYSHLVGNDFIPDVFIGRFSIDSITELIVLINKTIQYHRNPLAYNGEWLNRALVVAGNYSNTYPIPITPKWTSYWLRGELLENGYSSVDTVFYPPVQFGAPMIQAVIDAGVGLVNYRGWGDANGWHYPEFHVNDVAGLNNGWLTPVFTSFVCNANDFANAVDPCLGEALVRSGTPSAPKGGVAVIGPSDLHTSTRFNNVINAYMYDALLDGGIRELAPAMTAGLMGLIREFPQEDGPEEAQEFYFNVYNIVGDPSLSVHVGTPAGLTVEVDPVSAADGFVQVTVTDAGGDPVPGAVVAVLADDALVGKGLTDHNGSLAVSVPVGNSTQLDVYANRDGYVQGHVAVDVQSAGQTVVLRGVDLIDGPDGNGRLDIGEIVDVYPVFANPGTTPIPGSLATVDAPTGVQVITSEFQIPDLQPGEELPATSPFTIRVNAALSTGAVVLNLLENDAAWSATLAIPLTPLAMQLKVQADTPPAPNSTFTPVLRIANHGPAQFSNVRAELTSLSDSLRFVVQDGDPVLFSINPHDSITVALENVVASLGQVAYGSNLSLLVELWQDTVRFFTRQRELAVRTAAVSDPVAPTWHGYWAYDNEDQGYAQAPVFDWVELDPAYGGAGGTEYRLDDDDHVDVTLPFSFVFFGRTYDSLTISSNGWIAFIPCRIDYFWNFSIPMAMGPAAMVAAFWDDLEVIGTDSIRVYTRYESEAGRFIVEWSRALNGFDEATEETFEIILYDPLLYPTPTGDGVIDVQYLEIADIDATKNYSTVGIESHDQNEGLQYLFNNQYAPGAAPLENGRVIRFTTTPPANYVGPLETDATPLPDGFHLFPAYPNPFNPRTTFRFQLPAAGRIQLTLYDLLGREVLQLVDSKYPAGLHHYTWDGSDRYGQPVASGTYFLRLRYGEQYRVQKILLLR